MPSGPRTSPQNRIFHAICGEVSRHAKFNSRELSQQQWKVLLISGWITARGDDPELVTGLEGEFVSLRPSTAKLDADSMGDLIEYCVAWCVLNGIRLPR